MNTFIALIRRHQLTFLRDRIALFFSLLSVFVTIGLYVLFLKKIQVDFLQDVATNSAQFSLLVDQWFVAGILSIVPVTTTLAQFDIPIHDEEKKVMADFLTAPISRTSLLLSYMSNAIITGFLFTFIAFLLGELLIVINGGTFLSFTHAIQVLSILLLATILSSAMNALFTLYLKTENAFAIVSSLVGTFIGFLCGVYLPIGMLPTYVQYIIMYFPISHFTVLLRDIFMNDTLQNVFQHAPGEALEEYTLMFGVTYRMHGVTITPFVSYLFTIGAIGFFVTLLIFLYTKKYR